MTAVDYEALRRIVDTVVRKGTWYFSAIELGDFDGEVDGEELFKQAKAALGLPPDWRRE